MTDKCKTLLAAAAVGALAGAIAAAGVVFATKRKKLKNQAFLKAELELEQKLRNVRVVPVLGLDGVEKASVSLFWWDIIASFRDARQILWPVLWSREASL
eukprot:g29552.t1